MSTLNGVTHTVEIEIICGKAQRKRRSVEAGAFLIGASPECDLVLAAEGLPEICAILTVGPSGVAIRHVGQEPKLILNGQPTSQAQLADSDRFRVGPFEFSVRIRPAVAVTPPLDRAQHEAVLQRWSITNDLVDASAMAASRRLVADIRASVKQRQPLRRPA
jgi:hypothetical protein